MKAKKLTMLLAAAGLSFAPIVSASAAAPLSISRAAAPMAGASAFRDGDNDSAALPILGVVLLVLITVAFAWGNSGNSNPSSP